MLGCADDLHGRLGRRTAHIAYPYGAVDDAVVSRAARHFRFGYTTEFDALRHGDLPLRCPRLDMYYFQASGALEAWDTPGFRRRVTGVRIRRTIRTGLDRVWPS